LDFRKWHASVYGAKRAARCITKKAPLLERVGGGFIIEFTSSIFIICPLRRNNNLGFYSIPAPAPIAYNRLHPGLKPGVSEHHDKPSQPPFRGVGGLLSTELAPRHEIPQSGRACPASAGGVGVLTIALRRAMPPNQFLESL
jgi:hypothetical protein